MEEEKLTGAPEAEGETLSETVRRDMPEENYEQSSEDALPESYAAPDSDCSEKSAEEGDGEITDYGAVERADLIELKREFPELSSLGRIIDLSNPLRYAQLRDLGLSAKEAYLASSGTRHRASGKGHLTGAVPGGAKVADSAMSPSELKGARELFGNLTDEELQRLYRRVTK